MTPPESSSKAELRDAFRQRRRTLDPAWCADASTRLIHHLGASEVWQNASTVAGFLPMRGEPDLTALWQAAGASGKRVALPRVTETGLPFHAADFDRLIPGAFGILEPQADAPVIAAAAIDLFLVPGVAFDRHGGRLGMGKGYYDRALSGSSATLIGIAWEWQVVAAVPREPHDVVMTALCTEIAMHELAVAAGSPVR